MFTSIEYLKQKENPGVAIVHLFEQKHGYGVAFKQHVFGHEIWSCMEKVITFVKDDDIYTVITRHQIKSKVRLLKVVSSIQSDVVLGRNDILGKTKLTISVGTIPHFPLETFRR